VGAEVGGSELQLLALLKAQAKDHNLHEEHSVLLVRDGPLSQDFADVAPTVSLRKSHKLDLGFAYHLAKELRRQRPDILHTWAETPNLWGPLVARVAGRPAVVMAVVSLGDWKGRAATAADRVCFRLSDRVVGCAEAVTQAAQRRGAPAAKCATVPLGVELPKIPPLPGSNTVLLLGRFDPRKGHRYLLEAVPEVLASCPDAHFVITGTATLPVEVRTQAAAMELCHTLGLDDRVSLTGHRPADRAIAGADLLVVPSLSEGMPNVVLEAFARSRPVVGTVVGGIPEVVREGETGWLVKPADPHGLAVAIVNALSDAPERYRRGARARRVAELQNFASVVRRWSVEYELAASRHRRPHAPTMSALLAVPRSRLGASGE
jgi:glycosyltransferase involved in cell wall biosynthesis